jgi:proline iminopeptidase
MINPLYQPITPYSTGFLQVDDVHQIYWEQLGNPDGTPIVFLHGGPGGGASLIHRQYFDPHHFRIIIFDQRGAGRSHPLGEITDNTPAHLVNDMEKLRHHLRLEKWHLFGGSWGSTLALFYATQYPEHCLSLVLHGVFLMQPREIVWFTDELAAIFPEAHHAWRAALPDSTTPDPLSAYEILLTGGQLVDQIAAARAWCTYEMICGGLQTETTALHDPIDPKLLWALARLECHYFRHHLLTGAQDLIVQCKAAHGLPLTIIQGRYDMVCPMRSADQLHRSWPQSKLTIIPDGGHSSQDKPMQRALIQATNQLRDI